jgi:hypothetical protein
MASATQLIYLAAGSPPQCGDTMGICRCCGGSSVGTDFDRWVKDSFNDLDKCHTGQIVCHGCLFTFEEQSLTIQKLAGKEKPQKFRNYSYFVLKGRLSVLSKGQKPQIRDMLLQSPEVAIIALSGQKHIAFRARPGWWQIEEIGVLPFPHALAFQLEIVEALYNEGAGKEEIETGRYSQGAIQRVGITRWIELDRQLKPFRGSPQLQLAVYLAQKKEGDEKEDV